MKQTRKLLGLTITRRLIIGIFVIVSIAALIVWYSAHTLKEIDAANIERNRMLDARKTARSLEINVQQINIDLYYYSIQHDESLVRDTLASRAIAKASSAKLRTLTRNQETISELDLLNVIVPKRIASADDIVAAVRRKSAPTELANLFNARKPLDDQTRVYLEKIVLLEEKSSNAALQRVSVVIAQAQRNLIISVIILGIVVIIAAYYLYRSIVMPLRVLTAMADKLKNGELSATNTVQSHDELGTLGQTMNDMAREIERTDDIKSHFISIASHQLRTPATAVKQNLGLIVEGFAHTDADKSRFIRDAYESNEYQLAIIDDILNVARIEAGSFSLGKSPTDLGVLAEKVITELKPSAKEGQQISYSPPIKDVVVSVDANKIKMCLENLLSNALKYTPEHGHINISVANEVNEAVIKVGDNGVGIAKTDIPKLFAKFSRVHNNLSAKVGGTGLGLYLVRELIRLHGGRVDVESAPDYGSTFIIRIPKE